jgi:hypothetical protein
VLRTGLTLRQNKHVLRESRVKWHHKNLATRHLFYQPNIKIKKTPKIKRKIKKT